MVLGYPYPVSRPHSRVASRATSPALSSKSRKSMSSRNLPAYRHSYMESHLTDDESSESIGSYMDDLDIRRGKHDRRDSAGRSIRSSRQSSKSSPQRSFDEDSEGFSRRSYRHSARERRASSLARSTSSRTDRRPSRIRSDSTQDSETEAGTRALVQAKIREKVARAESLDGSSSDLWKPKPITPAKMENYTEKEPSSSLVSSHDEASSNAPKPASVNKTPDKPVKIVSKPVTERRKSVERTTKPKVSPETQKPVAKAATKVTTKATTTKASTATKPIEKVEPAKKEESPEKSPETETVEVSEADLANLPDTAPEGPPKTPDYEWTCEYCTFENEANVKICAVCCKTPSSAAIRKQQQAISENDKEPKLNGKYNDSADGGKEGRGKRVSRKITFWPGTKPK